MKKENEPAIIGMPYSTGGFGWRCFDGEQWHDCDQDGAPVGAIRKAVKQKEGF